MSTSFNSRVAIGLPAVPLSSNSPQDIYTLYDAVHVLHRQLSTILGLDTNSATVNLTDPTKQFVGTQFFNFTAHANGCVAGNFVAIQDNGAGQPQCVKAYSSLNITPGKRCVGWITSVTNNIATVATFGLAYFNADLIIGQRYYIADQANAGTVTAGVTDQHIGVAIAKRWLLVNIDS